LRFNNRGKLKTIEFHHKVQDKTYCLVIWVTTNRSVLICETYAQVDAVFDDIITSTILDTTSELNVTPGKLRG
jgi:hypothetical protein